MDYTFRFSSYSKIASQSFVTLYQTSLFVQVLSIIFALDLRLSIPSCLFTVVVNSYGMFNYNKLIVGIPL